MILYKFSINILINIKIINYKLKFKGNETAYKERLSKLIECVSKLE
jgi:hypothetical protein